MANLGKVLAAFAGGALVGAVAALLLTPQSGEETRKQIAEMARAKGLILNKEELEAFAARVMAKVKDYFTSEELEAAVEEAINESKA